MKTILIFSLIISATFCLSAEEINYTVKSTKVEWNKLPRGNTGLKAIGSINDRAYILFQPFIAIHNGPTIGGGNSGHYIGMFDKNVNLVKKTKLDLGPDGKKVDFEGAQIINNKILAFFSFQNEKSKSHYLFSRSVNPETLELNDDAKMIGELDYSGISKYKRTSVQYEISEDESKIMFFYTVLNRKNEPLRFAVYVYDHNLNSLWQNSVVPNFKEGVFSYKQFRVDNNSDVYLLGAHYADKKNYFDSGKFNAYNFFSKDTYFTDVPNFTYQLYKFSDGGTNETSSDIHLNSKFVRSMNFNVINGRTQVNGVFSDPETISARGAFAFTLDVESGEKTEMTFENFSVDLIEEGFSEKQLNRFRRSLKDKSEYDPFDYHVSEIKTLDDRTKYYTAEQFITGTKKEQSGNQITYTPIYHHNNVFIILLNADNSIKGIEKISKNQYSLRTSKYNSFIDFEKNGSLYFIYNTIEKKDGLFKNAELGETYITKIDGSGKTSEIYKSPESSKTPLMMPGTKVELHNHSILYGMMSGNFRNYMFEIIDVK
ncbi:hypothetical protein [Marinilabilia salmonicolor]|uniref:hypothetical protein n=1 Tax=Marinilabilia salmonicolor TaxID=989 RepID=UPI00029B34C5|nr:hypothetical protein [Marinilabilia salmonicolor]